MHCGIRLGGGPPSSWAGQARRGGAVTNPLRHPMTPPPRTGSQLLPFSQGLYYGITNKPGRDSSALAANLVHRF